MKRSHLAAAFAAGLAVIGGAAVASGPATSVTTNESKTVVTAPTTKVETSAEKTKVKVDAPYTNVKVDTEARHVRIRVPGYSGDIRW